MVFTRFGAGRARATTPGRAVVGLLALTATVGTLTAVDATTPAAAAPGSVIVSANFDTGGLPAGWRAVDGSWTVKNGRLYGAAASGSNKITFGRHLNDFRFEATVRFESVTEATRWTALGLDVPAAGTPPWWIATLRSGSTASNGIEFAQLTTANSWNVTNTAAAPSAAGTGRDVSIAAEVHGINARWFFAGREVLRTSSLQRSTGGTQALIVNGATVSFDNVKVTELAPSPYIRPVGAPLTVIAHRGASAVAPENTLVAQDIARSNGADWIENDVQPSKDGVPFVLHDSTVDRTTNGTGAIRNLTSTQLKQLDAGSWFGPAFVGVRIPTLAEQLADLRTRGGRLLLEIKGAHTKAEVGRIIDIVRAEQMTGRVFIQSFETNALKYSYELAPEIPLGLLRSTLDADPVAVARQYHLTAYNPAVAALTARPAVIASLHTAGVALMVWTVDSASQWQQLKTLGVDGVITNRSPELVDWNAANLG
ncbi:glycerophosphoryl diester phosphodiesterase [Micromonospora pisi]|uniref:Glycerophosphoryl diester phosphodiesterase n=1 Tax=Micromonospora pisi TaxID=589240 RepID=A0A495JQV0_9ACTN|nr:glycerophosphodiester phosphodiesterase family protein [Micromonospora pisi]RKR90762.1 glycerophosphoryl diester phosphodiesterase [Micromonospora pisi]